MKNMQIDFRSKPPTRADFISYRDALLKRKALAFMAYAGVAILVGYLLTLPQVQGEFNLAGNALVLVFIATCWTAVMKVFERETVSYVYAPLEKKFCEAMLAQCAASAEGRAYHAAVRAQHREFACLEYLAMMQFSKEKAQVEHCKAAYGLPTTA